MDLPAPVTFFFSRPSGIILALIDTSLGLVAIRPIRGRLLFAENKKRERKDQLNDCLNSNAERFVFVLKSLLNDCECSKPNS